DGINDFLNPLQIVAAGWRGVYEPEAVCHEEFAGVTGKEYRRRVRIVSRSWRAVFQARGVLNPWKVGFFAVAVLSHKVLRWWTVVLLLGAGVGTLGVLWPLKGRMSQRAWMAVATVLVVGAFLPPVRRLVKVGTYFVVLTAASFVGILRGSTGRVSGVWNTPRADAARPRAGIFDTWTTLALVLSVLALSFLGFELQAHPTVARVCFWVSASLLLYVFAGYPAVLASLRLLVRRGVRRSTERLPTVCMLVAANDEADVIGAKVQNALSVDYPPDRLRVAVVSDGSVDETNAIVRAVRDTRVALFAYPTRRGKIAALTDAIGHIHDEVIVLTDANAFLRHDALRALVANFADPGVGAVSGDVILTGERASLGHAEDLYYRYERWLQKSESELGSMVGVDGALYAVRRALFAAPPPDTVLDDMAVPFGVGRQGYRVVFERDALAYEVGSLSAWEEFARKSRIVAGAVQLLRRGRRQIPWGQAQVVFSLLSHKVLRWASPVLGAVFLTAAFALRNTALEFTVLWAGTCVTLLLGVLGCVPACRRLLPVAVCYYFCMVHLAAAVGILRGILGQQAVAWDRFERAPHDADRASQGAPPLDPASPGGVL
ncbi:MAG TPA: glycosyltransferase, partial [Luteitalea sp.]|nr:glycosyltransferase [Luteitalea sp.]